MAADTTIQRAGAIDSRVLLTFCLVATLLCLLAAAGLTYLNKRQKANLNRSLKEFETRKATTDSRPGKESFAMAIARVKQQEALTELRSVTNLLEKLNDEVTHLFQTAEALSTNSMGPQKAARQFFNKEIESVPTLAQIQARGVVIEPAILHIESAQGTTDLPDPHVLSEAQKTAQWANTASRTVASIRERQDQILHGAKTDVTSAPVPANLSPEQSSTLGRPDLPANVVEHANTNLLAETKAEAERTITKAKAEADRIVADAQAEAAQILSETRIEAARILLDSRKEAETLRAATNNKPFVPESAKDPTVGAPVAAQRSDRVKLTAAAEQNITTFQKLLADPKMRNQLLPFTTPGNMRLPGMFRAGKAPASLSQLKDFGALEPTVAGLNRLVEIASTPQDSVRPRWKFKNKKGVWQRKAKEVEQARTVQQLFIDFGPQFVAAGLLVD